MAYDILLSTEQLASLAEWASLDPGMAPILLAREGRTETVLAGQGDERVLIHGNGRREVA